MTTLITGLGNPGSEYENTRHNMGFLVADKLAQMLGTSFSLKKNLEASLAKASKGAEEIYLLKPQTYMNLSGQAVGKTLRYFDLKPENLIVIQDDLDLAFGILRSRLEGSHAGHNGLKSIEAHIGTRDFRRIKFGIANSHYQLLKQHHARDAIKDFVLAPLTSDEKQLLDKLVEAAAFLALDMITDPQAKTVSYPTPAEE